MRTAVGDRYVVERMRALGCNLGGEQSGHIILADYATTGDGLIAALQVLAAIVGSGRPASEICRLFEPVPQLLSNVRLGDAMPLERADRQGARSRGGEALGKAGRVLVRKSGTEPLIRVMAEGETSAGASAVVEDHRGDRSPRRKAVAM